MPTRRDLHRSISILEYVSIGLARSLQDKVENGRRMFIASDGCQTVSNHYDLVAVMWDSVEANSDAGCMERERKKSANGHTDRLLSFPD